MAIATAIILVILAGIGLFAISTSEPGVALPVAAQDDDSTSVSSTTESAVTTTDAPAPSTSAAPASTASMDGEAVYAEQCASCHGGDGSGGTGGAVNDTDLSLEEIIDVTTNGAPRMPAYSSVLAAEEIRAVAQYTQSLNS